MAGRTPNKDRFQGSPAQAGRVPEPEWEQAKKQECAFLGGDFSYIKNSPHKFQRFSGIDRQENGK
jgi:hypothetical protein